MRKNIESTSYDDINVILINFFSISIHQINKYDFFIALIRRKTIETKN